jgi:hypothetical protein
MNNRHSNSKTRKTQVKTKGIDRQELHRRLQDLTYFEKRNGYEFNIRFEELKRDTGFRVCGLRKIYDSHKGLFGVKSL